MCTPISVQSSLLKPASSPDPSQQGPSCLAVVDPQLQKLGFGPEEQRREGGGPEEGGAKIEEEKRRSSPCWTLGRGPEVGRRRSGWRPRDAGDGVAWASGSRHVGAQQEDEEVDELDLRSGGGADLVPQPYPQVDEEIEVGDVICEIETDKATLEFESLEEGYLAKILAPEGSKDVQVGQPIAVTVEDPEDVKNIPADTSFGGEQKEQPTANAAENVKVDVSEQSSTVVRISPAAKLLIKEHNLDESLLKASGPRGTLLKGDVLAALKSGTPSSSMKEKKAPAAPSSQPTRDSQVQSVITPQKSDTHEDLPNTQIRKVIAKRLLESKQTTPHLYLSKDVVLDPLLAFRNELKEQHGVKVSVNDIVIKAVALALRNVPDANAYWNNEKEEAQKCDSVDISIAVATEKGLMTPIIRNADQKTISSISSEVKQLAEKARAGKLAPNEFQGGTFSISNLGMYPVDHFCAIINPPQAGILAVGRGNKVVEPVVDSDGTGKAAVVTKMSLTLSADHRVFDGQVGGKFFTELALNFSDIRRLLL